MERSSREALCLLALISLAPRGVFSVWTTTRAGLRPEFAFVRQRLNDAGALTSVLELRGGSETPSSYPPSTSAAPPPTPSSSSYVGYYPPHEQEAPPGDNVLQTDDDPFHETVQERVDHWKTYQQEHAAEYQESPRDDKGRIKLLTSVSRASRSIFFLILMMRNVHLYEVADRTMTGLGRFLAVTPLALLFVANMAGAVASLTSPSHSAKKRLKAILNLDKLLEALLILHSFARLTVLPPPMDTPRESYIANLFHSAFFILQCQTFTRLSWDEKAAQPLGSYHQHQYDHGSSGVERAEPPQPSPPGFQRPRRSQSHGEGRSDLVKEKREGEPGFL
jgi:hypothetical protein